MRASFCSKTKMSSYVCCVLMVPTQTADHRVYACTTEQRSFRIKWPIVSEHLCQSCPKPWRYFRQICFVQALTCLRSIYAHVDQLILSFALLTMNFDSSENKTNVQFWRWFTALCTVAYHCVQWFSSTSSWQEKTYSTGVVAVGTPVNVLSQMIERSLMDPVWRWRRNNRLILHEWSLTPTRIIPSSWFY